MTSEVHQFIAACPQHAQSNSSVQQLSGLLRPLLVPRCLWSRIIRYFITGLPPPDGAVVIMTVVDWFSKEVLIAIEMAVLVLQHVVRQHSFPQNVVQLGPTRKPSAAPPETLPALSPALGARPRRCQCYRGRLKFGKGRPCGHPLFLAGSGSAGSRRWDPKPNSSRPEMGRRTRCLREGRAPPRCRANSGRAVTFQPATASLRQPLYRTAPRVRKATARNWNPLVFAVLAKKSLTSKLMALTFFSKSWTAVKLDTV
ncbi:uncharacterized protein LOC132397674 [Hypanus sabinus]|uniref:uncharacterized protein LOC132397674 n=1 Tax=Hypanus sabinus TaxID=79690 RepID=UPI0028C4254B|nr:uncharacterized protein LOC132397674 [Hypanus sabinus]